MRRIVPVPLVLLIAAVLIVPSEARVSVPQHSSRRPELIIPSVPAQQRTTAPPQPHPFSTEFYRYDFRLETTSREVHQQRSSWFAPVFTPVTSAASGLSKKVASLRRALVRMMP